MVDFLWESALARTMARLTARGVLPPHVVVRQPHPVEPRLMPIRPSYLHTRLCWILGYQLRFAFLAAEARERERRERARSPVDRPRAAAATKHDAVDGGIVCLFVRPASDAV